MYKKYARKPIGRRPRRSGYGKKRTTTRKGRGVSIATKQYVNKMIHKNIENKCNNNVLVNQDITTATSGVPYFVKVTPDSISQGITQSQRIGNEIRIVKAHYKGQVNLKPYSSISNASTCPIDVVMYLVKYKPNNNSPDFGSFFQYGASSGGFNNTPCDLWQTVNKDLWKLCAVRRFRLGYNGSTASPSYLPTNDGSTKFNQFFNIPLHPHLKKVQKYNDNQLLVQNDNLYLVVHPVQADGGNIDTVPIEWHYEYAYIFEDA